MRGRFESVTIGPVREARAKGFLPEEKGPVGHIAGRSPSTVTSEMPGPRTAWPRDRVDMPPQSSCPRLADDLPPALESQRQGSTPSKPSADELEVPEREKPAAECPARAPATRNAGPCQMAATLDEFLQQNP